MRSAACVLRTKGKVPSAVSMSVKVTYPCLSGLLTLHFVLNVSNLSPMNEGTFRYNSRAEKRTQVRELAHCAAFLPRRASPAAAGPVITGQKKSKTHVPRLLRQAPHRDLGPSQRPGSTDQQRVGFNP